MAERVLMGAYREIALVESYTDAVGAIHVSDSFRICPSAGAVWYQTVDLGYPAVRSAVQDMPQADGTLDQTAYMGARAVSIGLKILNNAFGDLPERSGWDPAVGWNNATWWVRYLTGWVTAARRVRLYLKDDTGVTMWCPLVGSQAPSAVSRESAFNRDMLLSFTNPTGKLFTYDTSDGATIDGRTYVRIAQTSTGVGGRTYPQDYVPPQKTYPVGAGATEVVYDGTVSNGFLARVYATGSTPMTGPKIRMYGPDDSVSEMSLSPLLQIAPGTIVEFDTVGKSVRSFPSNNPSVVSDLDGYKLSTVWPVLKPGFKLGYPPGRNAVEFSVASGDPGCYLDVIYQAANLL